MAFVHYGSIVNNIPNETKQKKKKKQHFFLTALFPHAFIYPSPGLIYLMSLQMEYCEKSTLRNCIDAGLYQDIDRVWRLFREIVEGLLHIHEQVNKIIYQSVWRFQPKVGLLK